jgi:hypothetical protein
MSTTVSITGQSLRWRSDFDLGIDKFRQWFALAFASAQQPSQHPSIHPWLGSRPGSSHETLSVEQQAIHAISNGSLYHQYIVF